jgi:hypothetical protein
MSPAHIRALARVLNGRAPCECPGPVPHDEPLWSAAAQRRERTRERTPPGRPRDRGARLHPGEYPKAPPVILGEAPQSIRGHDAVLRART